MPNLWARTAVAVLSALALFAFAPSAAIAYAFSSASANLVLTISAIENLDGTDSTDLLEITANTSVDELNNRSMG